MVKLRIFVIMKEKNIHVVVFENPYPPNFGGLIDVFYKIKYFKEINYSVILHIYDDNLNVSEALKAICSTIYTYKKDSNYLNFISLHPFSSRTRFDPSILINLKKDNHPILFEGLKTTFLLLKSKLGRREIYLRAHNIEHNYYSGLAVSERNVFKKIIFKIESYRLKQYEKKIMPYINTVLTLSNSENNYFKKEYNVKTVLLPVFHQNNEIVTLSPKGDYALYQGDLTVSDNKRVVRKLISVFSEINYPLIIAANICATEFFRTFSKTPENVTYKKIQNNSHLLKLFANAHINVLFSYQNSGTKLKLVNALYNSRFCLINENMTDDDNLMETCIVEKDLSKYTNIISKVSALSYNKSTNKKTSLVFFEEKKKEIFNELFLG